MVGGMLGSALGGRSAGPNLREVQLLRAGADPTLKNAKGYQPIHLIASCKRRAQWDGVLVDLVAVVVVVVTSPVNVDDLPNVILLAHVCMCSKGVTSSFFVSILRLFSQRNNGNHDFDGLA